MTKKKRKISGFLQRMKMKLSWFFLEERCVLPLCRRRTGVLKKTPVDERDHYVEGSGQPCSNCWEEIYQTKY